jgi:hypothetical protein
MSKHESVAWIISFFLVLVVVYAILTMIFNPA